MNNLTHAGGAGLLLGDAEDGGRRKLSWMRLLQKKIETYTQGESSSVPLETAGSLLRSILYTAALAPNGVTEDLKEPESLYREGRDILFRQFRKGERLCYLVRSTALSVDCPCYREAVQTGVPAFFRDYDMEFEAQETPGDFDYPASMPCSGTGITWMLSFLETLYWENVFCRRFPAEEVEGTLKAHGIWGVAIPVNIFEPVFAAALRGYLFNMGEPSSLAVHTADNERLIRVLASISSEDVFRCVKESCERMMEDMEIKSVSFRELLLCQAEALAGRLAQAVMHGNADGVFPPWESPPLPVLSMDGDPMEDGDFRALHAELSSCRYFSDKLMLIKRRVHSLQDITWLMESGCFAVKEMTRVFSLLCREELAALLRMGRSGLPIQGRWVFPETAAIPKEAQLWEKSLYGYLDSLGPVRRKEIEIIAGQMHSIT